MSMSVGGATSYARPYPMSGASMRMPPQQKMENLYSKIDTSGTGSITKDQFDQAFQTMNPPAAFKSMGTDAAFAGLDPNGTGSVSKADFVSGMKSLMAKSHTHHSRGVKDAADAGTDPTAAAQSTALSASDPTASTDPAADTTATPASATDMLNALLANQTARVSTPSGSGRQGSIFNIVA
ncbi:hypothetical protein [Azospirillum melinis]